MRVASVRRVGDEGMTLIETTVALALISVALFGLLGELVVSARAQHQDTARTVALRLANDRVEKVRAMAYDAVSATTSPTSTPATATATRSLARSPRWTLRRWAHRRRPAAGSSK